MKEEVRCFFPYEDFRVGQKEIIELARGVFSQGKIALLHAPTGVGKTAAALSGYFSTQERDSTSLMALTRTKSQSRIYTEELEKINENKDKSISYSILRSKKDLCILKRKRKDLEDLPYHKFLRACSLMQLNDKCTFFNNSHEGNLPSSRLIEAAKWTQPRGTQSRLLKAARKFSVCPYELAKHLVTGSKVIICSFNYVFSSEIRKSLFSSIGLSFDKIRFIIDEAHGLPGFISTTLSDSLSTYTINRAMKEIEKVSADRFAKREVKPFLSDLLYKIDTLSEKTKALSHLFSPQIIEKNAVSRLLDLDMVEKLSEIGSELAKRGDMLLPSSLTVADFLEKCIEIEGKERYALTVECGRSKRGNMYKKLGCNLIDPSQEAKQILKRMTGALLLSGSLYPPEYFEYILGLEDPSLQDKTNVRLLSSEFLQEKRKIIVDLATTTKYEKRNRKTFSKIAERICSVMETLPKDKAVLVVFPSYGVKKRVRELVNLNRPLFDEKRETKIQSTLEYITSNPSAAVFSVARGKLTEGIDFRKDNETLLAGVILVGLPFPKFDQLAKYTKKYFDKRVGKRKAFYLTTIAPTVRASVQAGGRLIRDKEDAGVIVILDKRFPRYKKHFPEDWQDVYLIEEQRGLEAEISSFFRSLSQED